MSDEGFIQSGPAVVTVQSKLKDRIDVRDFGAKGNGLDDDSEAIRRAIEFASSSGGQTVFFGKGKYRCHPSPWWWRAYRYVQRRIQRWWWRLP